MRISGIFVSLALSSLAFGAPAKLLKLQTFAGEKTGRFIVELKDGSVNTLGEISSLRKASSSVNITHQWDAGFFNGFAGHFDDATLEALLANPNVAGVSEDGIMHTQATVTQTNAPWGLARLSQAGPTGGTVTSTAFSYRYDSTAGAGVDIYVVDTGIFTGHSDFGGRARWGDTFGPYADADGNGHGTHVSGTAAGSRWGVAKAANLIAVKVLSDAGSGTVADIVSGLNFVASSAASSGRPSIATLSLGGSPSTALDNAITSLVNRGIHVTVAAGNDNANAANTSPARVAVANTIGASTITDARASFSNFGAVVDIFAPGQDVTSSWIGSSTATNRISGTSMATPHVAGLIAYLIGHSGNASPATITTRLKSLGNSGRLTGVPSGTVNLLARNDIA